MKQAARWIWSLPWPSRLVTGLALAFGIWLVQAAIRQPADATSVEEQVVADVSDRSIVALFRPINLRNAAETSYLVVARRPARERAPASSDEVLIYDQAGGHVQRGLALRPLGLPGSPPMVKAWGGLVGNPTPREFRFSLLTVEDFDRDGGAEVYGLFKDQISGAVRPLVIAWSDAKQDYLAWALISEKPVTPVYDGGHPGLSPAHWARREARVPLVISLSPGDLMNLYGAAAVVVERIRPYGPLLLLGFPALTISRPYHLSSRGKRARADGGVEMQFGFGYGKRPVVGRLVVEAELIRFNNDHLALQRC